MQASELTEPLTACCADVLDSMYFTSVNSTEVESALPETSGEGNTYRLTFSGDVSGIFGLSVDASTAGVIAANFLGEDESGVSPEEAGEVIGELANILCGSMVSGIASKQIFVLSHPESIDAHVFSNLPGSVPQDLLALKMDTDNGIVRVWIVLEPNGCAS